MPENELYDDDGGAEYESEGDSVVDVATGEILDFDLESEIDAEPVLPENHNANLVEFMTEDKRNEIQTDVKTGFESDRRSRRSWEELANLGMVALGILKDTKLNQEMFLGSCKAIHPGLSVAVLHFWGRCIREFIKLNGPVKTSVAGEQLPEAMRKAKRVAATMNHLWLNVIPHAVPDDERAFFSLPLLGSVFKKVYLDSDNNLNARYVSAVDFYVSYYGVSCLEECPRSTEVINGVSRADLLYLMNQGHYRTIELKTPMNLAETSETSVVEMQNKFEGTSDQEPGIESPADTFVIYEQHTRLQIEDTIPYPVPYIVTILDNAGDWEILRIERNWKVDDARYKPNQFYVHYRFPGVGFYGYGFYHHAPGLVDTQIQVLRALVNQGRFANQPPGFMSGDLAARMGEANISLTFGEWKVLKGASAEDMQRGVKQIDMREPSAALISLLQLMDAYQQRLFSTTDVALGEVTNEMPVGTAQIMVEGATTIPNAIMVMMHISRRKEFLLLHDAIREKLEIEGKFAFTFQSERYNTTVEDFDETIDVMPNADPNAMNAQTRMVRAQTVLQLASMPNSTIPIDYALDLMLEALDIDPKSIPRAQPQAPQPDPQQMLEMEKGKREIAQMEFDLQRSANELSNQNQREELDREKRLNQIRQSTEKHEIGKENKTLSMMRTAQDMVLNNAKANADEK